MTISRTQGLVLLNGAILAALAAVTLGPSAGAQTDRRRGEFSIVSGSVKGSDAAVVWIVDSVNQDLVAVIWNAQQNKLEGLGYRDLMADVSTLSRGNRN